MLTDEAEFESCWPYDAVATLPIGESLFYRESIADSWFQVTRTESGGFDVRGILPGGNPLIARGVNAREARHAVEIFTHGETAHAVALAFGT